MNHDINASPLRLNAIAIALSAFSSASALAAPAPITPSFAVASLQGASVLRASRGADGSLAIAWLNRASDGSNPQVPHVRIFRRDGSAVGPAIEVPIAGESPSASVDVAVAANGSFVLGWLQYGSPAATIKYLAQRYSPAGVPISPVVTVTETEPGDSIEGISIATDRDGDFVGTWGNYSTRYLSPRVGYFALIQTLESTHARRFSATGTPIGDEILVHREPFRLTLGSSTPDGPKVAMDADGEFVVLRQSNHDPDLPLFSRRYRADGSAVGPEQRVTPASKDQISQFAVTIADDGRFVVGWTAGTFPDEYLRFRRFGTAGYALALPQAITTPNTADRLSLSGDARGNFFALWDDITGDGGPSSTITLREQAFNASGATIGTAFQPGAGDSGHPDLGVIASDPLGNVAAAWVDFGTAENNWAQSIRAQLFTAP